MSASHPAAFAHDFVYSLGDQKLHVRESAAAGRLRSAPKDLLDAGFEWHHVAGPDTTAFDLASAAVRQLSDQDRLGTVDAIVYSTCLPANGNVGDTQRFADTGDVKHLMDFPASRLQAAFDLDSAAVIGLNQQACTSMIGSLKLARALLADDPSWNRVLCVTADRFPPGALYEQAYNVISDGAAACLVSRSARGFRIMASRQITNGALSQATDDETVGTYFNYTHRLIREVTAEAGVAPGDLAWVIPQNTNDKAWEILARLSGVDRKRVWFPTLPDVGHVISSDVVANLDALIASSQIQRGDLVLLVMAGFGLNWQAVVLEACGGDGR